MEGRRAEFATDKIATHVARKTPRNVDVTTFAGRLGVIRTDDVSRIDGNRTGSQTAVQLMVGSGTSNAGKCFFVDVSKYIVILMLAVTGQTKMKRAFKFLIAGNQFDGELFLQTLQVINLGALVH